MEEFFKKHVLDIILVVLLIVLIVAVAVTSHNQRVSYQQSYEKYTMKEDAKTSPTPLVGVTFKPISPITISTPTPEATAKTTPRPTPKPIPIYDIKLSEELQRYTYKICKEYNVEYELALSVMFVESSFNQNVIGSSGEVGCFQIHPINFRWLRKELGVLDFYNVRHNIKAGIYMLSDLQNKFSTINEILMAYNMGESGSRYATSRGINRTTYTTRVQRAKEKLLKEGKIE